jgi:uncharacterized protein YgfB (UPF0149 family)
MTTLPKYNDLAKELIKSESPFHPSEAHGFLAGLATLSLGDSTLSLSFFNPPGIIEKKIFLVLEQLFEYTRTALAKFSVDFSLLLPPDKKALQARIESIVLWVQGYLTAINQNESAIYKYLDAETLGALKDITEIASLDYESEEFSNPDKAVVNENEAAYIELVECVRMITLMVYYDYKMALEAESKPNTIAPHLLH